MGTQTRQNLEESRSSRNVPLVEIIVALIVATALSAHWVATLLLVYYSAIG